MYNMKGNLYRFLFLVFFIIEIISFCTGENVKKSVDDNREDNGDNDNEGVREDSQGMVIPPDDEAVSSPSNNNSTVCARRQNSQMHEIRQVPHSTYSFIVAILSEQDFLCSGTTVSNGLIVTSAKCTQQVASHVLLNATSARRSEGTVLLPITKKETYPTFTGDESAKDIGLIYTEKWNVTIGSQINLSNFTDSSALLDFEALGYGLNAELGKPKDLQIVGLETRYTMLVPNIVTTGYFDCVDTKVPTCFRDFGGPIIFGNELVGVVIEGQENCIDEMSSKFSANQLMVKVLPIYVFKSWLDEKIKKNAPVEAQTLSIFPAQPKSHRHKLVQARAGVDNYLPGFYNSLSGVCMCYILTRV